MSGFPSSTSFPFAGVGNTSFPFSAGMPATVGGIVPVTTPTPFPLGGAFGAPAAPSNPFATAAAAPSGPTPTAFGARSQTGFVPGQSFAQPAQPAPQPTAFGTPQPSAPQPSAFGTPNPGFVPATAPVQQAFVPASQPAPVAQPQPTFPVAGPAQPPIQFGTAAQPAFTGFGTAPQPTSFGAPAPQQFGQPAFNTLAPQAGFTLLPGVGVGVGAGAPSIAGVQPSQPTAIPTAGLDPNTFVRNTPSTGLAPIGTGQRTITSFGPVAASSSGANPLFGPINLAGNPVPQNQPPRQQPPAPNELVGGNINYVQAGVGNEPNPQVFALAQATAPPVVTAAARDSYLAKTAMKEAELPLLTIVRSNISLYSYEEMKRIANHMRVTIPQFAGGNTVNDDRMGVVNMNQACGYCLQIDCPGHYGIIDFEKTPIYNPAYIREVVQVLSCVCNDCGGLLLTEDVMRQKGLMKMSYDRRLAELEKQCKDVECLKIFPKDIIPCGKNPVFITTDIREKGTIIYKIPSEGTRKVTNEDASHPMQIERVIDILDRISDSDARLLGFPKGTHPRNMIMKAILVPPKIARPPVFEGNAVHHDQMTHMFVEIMQRVLQTSTSTAELYKSVRNLIFKSDSKKMGGREIFSLVERLQGKGGLLRSLSMGKRNNHCGRTVAGPDPSLKFGQIRIPVLWKSVLTKKVSVTQWNIDHIKDLMRRNQITHITFKDTGLRKYFHPDHDYELQVGDQVDRYLENGDRIVTNRQPTLHRQSMMGYEVVLGEQLTIGLHLSYTSPMNCDFDGDENNAWNPQDFEVEAEVDSLMNVKENIMSAEQNKPIMGMVMNSVTSAYLLSHPATRVNDDLFKELIEMVTDKSHLDTLYGRLLKYGVHPRSGQAVFSAILPPDFYYDSGSGENAVEIKEGILIRGRLKKAHVGASNRSIIQELYKKYGSEITSNFFTDAPWILNKWLIERGFSVGIRDCISLDDKGNDRNQQVLKRELAKIYVELEALGGKLKDPDEEDFRKRQINNLVNISQGVGLKLAKKTLRGDNSIGIMTDQQAGTKGSTANVGQMFGSVGQQFFKGERLQATISGGRRLLPSFDLDDNNPEAHAFLPQSYYTGLKPEGLFFQQAAGRENILDTALKTADTGSMQHRIIKALENITIAYDGSVRNTIGTMFSPIYNSGFDTAEMIAVRQPGKDGFSSFIDIASLAKELNAKRGWVTEETKKIVDAGRKVLQDQNVIPKVEDENAPENAEENVIPTPPQPLYQERVLKTNAPPPVESPVRQELVLPAEIPPPFERKITKFERARIIGTRAMQLDNNAPLLMDIGDELDPVKIAKMEFSRGLIGKNGMYVVRKYPDGYIEKVYPTEETIDPRDLVAA